MDGVAARAASPCHSAAELPGPNGSRAGSGAGSAPGSGASSTERPIVVKVGRRAQGRLDGRLVLVVAAGVRRFSVGVVAVVMGN